MKTLILTAAVAAFALPVVAQADTPNTSLDLGFAQTQVDTELARGESFAGKRGGPTPRAAAILESIRRQNLEDE